jgi:carboxypeptidase C (cathepsin A)
MRNMIIKGIKKIFTKNNNPEKNLKLNEEEDGLWPYMMCGDDLTVDTFLNLNETKRKMHVYNESVIWTQCAYLNYEWSDSIHLYNTTLLKYPNVKKWLLSGTEDGVITTIGTMRWIHKIGFKVNKTWTKWKAQKQISGYVQSYEEGLVLVTIKGAGHMAPQDKRLESKFVLDSFLKGVLPDEFNK